MRGYRLYPLLESCAVEPSRVDCITVSCIYSFYTTRICISNYINNVHFIEYPRIRGVPDCIPNNLHELISPSAFIPAGLDKI